MGWVSLCLFLVLWTWQLSQCSPMVSCIFIFPSPHLADDLHRIKSYLLVFWLSYDLPRTVCPPARGPQAGSVDSAPHFPLKPKHTPLGCLLQEQLSI